MRRIYNLVLAALWSCAPGAWGQAQDLAARTRGRADAPITIYEMSDFQCPYCRQFALETMPALGREYIQSGKVRLIYINLPMTHIHPHAAAAAEVALCAARQGKFWVVHDLLFLRQPQWAAQREASRYLVALADSAGVDHLKLVRCLESKTIGPAVDADIAAAGRAGASSTPTFYIEGGLIEGAAPVAVFREVLDSIYRSKTTPAH